VSKPRALVTLVAHAAAQIADQLSHEGEAEALPASLSGHEGFEDMIA
jgi:hypothetical protein